VISTGSDVISMATINGGVINVQPNDAATRCRTVRDSDLRSDDDSTLKSVEIRVHVPDTTLDLSDQSSAVQILKYEPSKIH
jgi:hypothetical protein